MKNYIQKGDTLTVIAPADVLSGKPVIVGAIFGVAATDALSGAQVEVDTVGVFELPKVTTDVITAGAKLYWDATAGKLTITAGTGSKPMIGFATEAAGNGATVVRASLQWTGTTGPS